MSLFYQDIMKVPGLTGSRYQDRGRQLYEMLGSPLGPYTGSRSQNIMLQNKIKENNFYSAGLPGATSTGSGSGGGTNPQDTIADDFLTGHKPNTDIYSEDVMKQDAWFDPFDAWTQSFVQDYMEPEWMEKTFNPAMKKMNNQLGQANQQVGASGAWRTSGAHKNLADMATEMGKEEQAMKQAFQEETLAVRDQIRAQLAAPLYNANMTRWGDAPWRNIDTEGADMAGASANLGPTLGGESLEDLLEKVSTWTPDASGGGTQRDWTVNPGGSYGGLSGSYMGGY